MTLVKTCNRNWGNKEHLDGMFLYRLYSIINFFVCLYIGIFRLELRFLLWLNAGFLLLMFADFISIIPSFMETNNATFIFFVFCVAIFFQTVWMTILMGMFFNVFFIKDDKEEIIFRLSDMRQSISATVIEINYCFCGNSQHNLITLNIKNKVGFIVNKLFGLIVPHLINW